MNLEERAMRITVATEHFAAYGMSTDAERLRTFLNDTAPIPLGIFREACSLARQLNETGWPPDAGKVIARAVSISPREHDATYQGNPSDIRPEWYTDIIRAKRRRARRMLDSRGRPLEIADEAGRVVRELAGKGDER